MTTQLTISHGMCLPMLNEFGSEEQKEKYLSDNISAKTVWCQMFSEPGAGSDVQACKRKLNLTVTNGLLTVRKSGPLLHTSVTMGF